MELNVETCAKIAAAAMAKALDLGTNVSIAVVDAGGNLKSFTRMDGAEIAGPSLAVDKAYTAISNRISTEELGTLAQPGGPLFGIHSNGNGRFVIFGGGVPVIDGGQFIGAIGVSGGAVEEDIAIAEAALAALQTP